MKDLKYVRPYLSIIFIASSSGLFILYLANGCCLLPSAGTISSSSIPQCRLWSSIFSIGIPAWDFLFIVRHPFRAGVLKPDRQVTWPEQLQMPWQFTLRKLGKLHKIIQKEKKKREISETCLEIETCFQCKFRRLKCKRTSNYQTMDSLRSEVLSYSWFLHCQVKCLKTL